MGLTFLCVLLLLSSFLSYGHSQERPPAVLSLQPNSSQMFTGESVTFICDMREGEKTDWDYRLDKDAGPVFEYRRGLNTFILPLLLGDSGEYQCTGSRINNRQVTKSNKVTLIVSDHKPKATLKADQTDLPVGGSVTLTCSVDGSSGWKWRYYRYQHDSYSPIKQDGVDQFDGSISVPEGGVYQCIGIRGKRNYYTEQSDRTTIDTILPQPSVTQSTQPTVTGSAKPSVPPLVVGLIVGFLVVILLTILLLLLCRYRTSKDPCCVRSVKSQGTNQDSVSDQRTNHRGGPEDGLSPLQHDEPAAESGDVTYSQIEIKHMVKKKKEKPAESDPLENCLYSEVKTGSAKAPEKTENTQDSEVKPE